MACGKVVTLAAALAEQHGLPGWRQHEHLLQNVKTDRARDRPRVACQEAKGRTGSSQGYEAIIGLGGGPAAAGPRDCC